MHVFSWSVRIQGKARLLAMAVAIARAARLAAKRLRGAEYVHITLKEY